MTHRLQARMRTDHSSALHPHLTPTPHSYSSNLLKSGGRCAIRAHDNGIGTGRHGWRGNGRRPARRRTQQLKVRDAILDHQASRAVVSGTVVVGVDRDKCAGEDEDGKQKCRQAQPIHAWQKHVAYFSLPSACLTSVRSYTRRPVSGRGQATRRTSSGAS